MAHKLVYEIARTYANGCRIAWTKRYRADAARVAFLQEVFDGIAAQGLRDTHAGHAAMAQANQCNVYAPPDGCVERWGPVRVGNQLVVMRAERLRKD